MTFAGALSRPSPEAPSFRLGRLTVEPQPCGCAYLPAHDLLVVADLHLEKGSAFARGRQFLPPYDTRATLERLAATIARLSPRGVVALGDSWHDAGGLLRMTPEDRALLAGLQARRDWIWIAGNHDAALVGAQDLPGTHLIEIELDGVRLVHTPDDEAAPQMAGHLHPVARVNVRGRSLRRRAFALDGQRLILPAMGAYAGGLNLRDGAFAALFPQGLTALIMGDSRLFRIGYGQLLPD
jgi:DNA ligase-associated metallophosphoesterase